MPLNTRKRIQPQPEPCAVIVPELEGWRADLARRHGTAKNSEGRIVVELDARVILKTSLPVLMGCWLGIPGKFNGPAVAPGSARIASGYFAASVL